MLAHRMARLTVGSVVLALVAVICSIVPARTAVAQQPSMPIGMPGLDLSKAPKDIQAIWKKLQSGGIPTPAEAQRLGQWMQAHASDVAKSTTAQMAQKSGTGARVDVSGLTDGDDEVACPTRSSALAQLGTAAPTRRSALALLDTIRATYAALEKPSTVQGVQRALTQENVAALRERGAASLLGGYDAITVLTYIEAVHRATGTDVQGAWGDLGAALVELGDAAHAVPVLRYALTLGPRSPLIVHNLGIAYADLGDLKSAATLVTEVTRAAPHFGGAYDALAKIESCAGNMTAAWHAMAQAQEVDWTSDREKKLDQHDTPSAQSSDDQDADDAAEAAKPLPTPHGPSAFPPPPATHGASSFQPATPALPDSWREAAARTAFYLSQANQYGAASTAALQRGMSDRSGAQAESAIEAEAADAAAHGMQVITVSVKNGHEATDAADVVTQRAAARMALTEKAFHDKWLQVVKQEQARQAPLERQLTSCEKAHPTAPSNVCLRPYCKALNGVWDQSYADARAAARVAVGGFAGTASELHRVLMSWFAWAGDPGSRVDIDSERLRWLAYSQQRAFMAAYLIADYVASWRGSLCDSSSMTQTSGSAELTTGSPNDPGKCEKKAVNMLVLKITESCDRLLFVLKPFVIVGPEGRVDYHAASSDRNGTLFVTMGAGLGAGPLKAFEAHGGLGMTFDQSGLVTGFGPAAGGGMGITALTGRVSGTGMVNLLDSGPAVAGTGGYTPSAALSFAAGPNFGGKM